MLKIREQPGAAILVPLPLDIKWPLESSESILTILLKFFGVLSIKSLVWGSLLLGMSGHAKFEVFFGKANGPIACLPSAE